MAGNWELAFTDCHVQPAREGSRIYETEAAFVSAVADAFLDLRKSGFSAVLADGRRLDEAALRRWIADRGV